jgi:hypothetical protein
MAEAVAILPVEVSDLDIAFPASVRHLLPEAPRDFPNRQKWERFQSDWFGGGLKDVRDLKPKAGIDKTKALRHLKCIQGSFEPKHEDKVSAVAYLASLWFEADSTWR